MIPRWFDVLTVIVWLLGILGGGILVYLQDIPVPIDVPSPTSPGASELQWWANMVTTIGFPIVVVIAIGFFFWRIWVFFRPFIKSWLQGHVTQQAAATDLIRTLKAEVKTMTLTQRVGAKALVKMGNAMDALHTQIVSHEHSSNNRVDTLEHQIKAGDSAIMGMLSEVKEVLDELKTQEQE